MKGPDPRSNRSKKRASRGFVSLEQSSRKHRRAQKRLLIACTLAGKLYAPGEKTEVQCGLSKWMHTAGGSIRHY